MRRCNVGISEHAAPSLVAGRALALAQVSIARTCTAVPTTHTPVPRSPSSFSPKPNAFLGRHQPLGRPKTIPQATFLCLPSARSDPIQGSPSLIPAFYSQPRPSSPRVPPLGISSSSTGQTPVLRVRRARFADTYLALPSAAFAKLREPELDSCFWQTRTESFPLTNTRGRAVILPVRSHCRSLLRLILVAPFSPELRLLPRFFRSKPPLRIPVAAPRALQRCRRGRKPRA